MSTTETKATTPSHLFVRIHSITYTEGSDGDSIAQLTTTSTAAMVCNNNLCICHQSPELRGYLLGDESSVCGEVKLEVKNIDFSKPFYLYAPYTQYTQYTGHIDKSMLVAFQCRDETEAIKRIGDLDLLTLEKNYPGRLLKETDHYQSEIFRCSWQGSTGLVTPLGGCEFSVEDVYRSKILSADENGFYYQLFGGGLLLRKEDWPETLELSAARKKNFESRKMFHCNEVQTTNLHKFIALAATRMPSMAEKIAEECHAKIKLLSEQQQKLRTNFI